MEKRYHIDCYAGFKSLREIIEWLKADWHNRRVLYDGDLELAVFTSYDKETKKHDLLGSNVETFNILDRWFDDDPEVRSLEEYFDEKDQPIEDAFARDYDLSRFHGEEVIMENVNK